LRHVAKNPKAGTEGIISKHVSESTKNIIIIIIMFRGSGCKRKRATANRNTRESKKAKTTKRDVFS
jgi:hypothetical protein